MNVLEAAAELLAARRSGALATVLSDGRKALFDSTGSVVAGDLPDRAAAAVAAAVPDLVRHERSRVVAAPGSEVFVEALVPPPRLLIFGAGPIAEALCTVAAVAGFVVEVADPRPAFARPERFPAAGSVTCGWPDQLLAAAGIDPGTYVVSLLHEARFEDQLLRGALRTDARYVGALGSRRTHDARVARLIGAGFSAGDVERIRGPIGLAIGASTPEEVAVSIVAEMIAVRRGFTRPDAAG